MNAPRVGIVAGEVSGDRLGAGLIRALRERCPGARFEGIGGPQMTAAGCRSHYPMERLSVMGLTEAAVRYLELLPVRARLARTYLRDPPDVFVGVDAPDFNLALEGRLRRAGIKTVHYVSPAVWAWRSYRVHAIRRAVDLMLTLFPFEERFYAERGVRARFVGHPIADDIPRAPDQGVARRRLGVPKDAEVIALLPGSRLTEVGMLAAPMIGAAGWLARRRPRLHFLVPLANPITRRAFERVLARDGQGLSVQILDRQAWPAMAAADVILLASGTAALEAMLHKRPMVITYRTMRLTWAIGRRMLHVRHVGLPNLLAGRTLVPELLQDYAVPRHLGAAVLMLLERPELNRSLRSEFERIHDRLRNDADRRAAEAVIEVIAA